MMHNRTVRRAMNREGFKYLHLRKKGVLYPDDLEARLKFANKCRNVLPPDFWRKGVSLFLDGVGFEYKRNPCKSAVTSKTMGWRRRNQGLNINFTAKGKKEGKKQVKFYVGISYGVGVVMCKHFAGNLNADRYCEIIVPKIEEGIALSCNPIGKRILQDNCPVMNAVGVVDALTEIGACRFKIPARSRVINCIENVFHEMLKAIQNDVITRKIDKETFAQFSRRAKNVIKNYPISKINKVIDSMWKRIDAVIKRHGQRTKY